MRLFDSNLSLSVTEGLAHYGISSIMSEGVDNKQICSGTEKAESNPLQAVNAKLLELPSSSGPIKVFEGLPPFNEHGWAWVPYDPYVFEADQVEIPPEGGQRRGLNLENQVVLVMHGNIRRNRIYSDYFKSQAAAYALDEIIDAYERSRGRKIDILAVCSYTETGSTGEEDLQRTHATYRHQPFPKLEDKIHTIYDKARVLITKDSAGKVKVDLSSVSGSGLFIPKRYFK